VLDHLLRPVALRRREQDATLCCDVDNLLQEFFLQLAAAVAAATASGPASLAQSNQLAALEQLQIEQQ
jgi:hypothetical protein